MQQLGMGQAVNQALREEMSQDPDVFIAGEGVGVSIHESPMLPTAGLLKAFGPERVRDTPVSEAAIAGLAVGAAEAGLKPVVEIMFNPFFTLASDMIVNHAAKLRYLSGGKSSFPLVVRMKAGAGFGAGCQHSHNLEAWVAHCPGLKVVMPGTPADAKGLLKSAIRDPNPVVFIEDMMLYFVPGPVPEGEYLIPIGEADIKRQGRDVTVVTWSKMVGTALKAAEELAREGVEAEIVDLRTLVPLDTRTILSSVRKTGRLVVLHEATRTGGFAGEVAAVVMEEAFADLKAPLRRVTGPDIPVPASPPLERFYIPDAAQVVSAVKEIL
ncbi:MULTISPECIES: alpha-ketoacid dehydrogenase subunit beta [Desulfococcus]|jgi:pyruvate dehydrogenase E1 component beta subunit|uniref:Transketolase domain-containing protein n=1 Tax=Desulfococcus multivorans DSM 2059 TaxID=1121405 RepID=S7TQ40_DESML|nr:alpha-ketoacid dehydrogenase subunit beta [Desulfococcus multivorans]AOY57490.1 AcoB: TPP-dependent acetoin dehydrogenase E1, subunit beta [Desulfococcus multivorans]AQU99920.1 alpha-ketoacid dehydrogenase subunit beta [Desulfococcus multivorans]EPR39332.1 Transketolase domain-containing protein [Desulfococcus multivorans DSM 2059]MDX9818427.1 alpha-ketoacid dehydrogenase subunit beta [Desulfococcus multivorans]SKA12842.1 pyruvate dehydrogenase E1 component beta subunit [Desulfococcus multi